MSRSVPQPMVKLFYAGTEITGDVSGNLVSFSYTDQAYDKADSIDVVLEDRESVWKGGWLPAIGGVMAAGIYYRGDGISLPLICGLFTVDDMQASGPPDIVSIKAVSASVTTALRNEKKSKARENTSLKKIAGDVAEQNGLTLYWEADDVEIKRADQRQVSDLAFVKELLQRYGIKVKVADGKMICRGLKQMDIQVPLLFLQRGHSDIIRFSFNHKAHGIFKKAQVDYFNPEDKEHKQAEFEASDPELVPAVGNTLKVNERAETKEQAEKRAEGELRDKNKDQTTGDITLVGNTTVYAGTTALITGFGLKFDGLWLITEARHSVSRQGYQTAIRIRKTFGW